MSATCTDSSSTPAATARQQISDELLRALDRPGPRYTSYPTADRFGPGFGAADALQALASTAGATEPLSLYVHIPFCEALCWYCACNKIVTRHHDRATAYLAAVESELRLVSTALAQPRTVSQLHLGGGSPTFMSDAELSRLMAALRQHFRFDDEAELSIEVDPRTVTPERLAHLRRLGFNRLSFGVQDFDPQVQQAVHREQSFESVRDLMASARALGCLSINADLIYGLPKQGPASFARTLAQINALRPDRIALYAYAHLPERFKPQRRIAVADLPTAAARIDMLGAAIASFLAHGYCTIGMDHFALPHDELAIAKQQGWLQRNFQGYSTQPDRDLVALGVSAIGRVGGAYYQNAKSLAEYEAALAQGQLPVVRGLRLSADDTIRRDVIMALMCQGLLVFGELQAQHGICVPTYFAQELAALRELQQRGLVEIDGESIRVTAAGWFGVRGIAAVFDRYLQGADGRGAFSKMV